MVMPFRSLACCFNISTQINELRNHSNTAIRYGALNASLSCGKLCVDICAFFNHEIGKIFIALLKSQVDDRIAAVIPAACMPSQGIWINIHDDRHDISLILTNSLEEFLLDLGNSHIVHICGGEWLSYKAEYFFEGESHFKPTIIFVLFEAAL